MKAALAGFGLTIKEGDASITANLGVQVDQSLFSNGRALIDSNFLNSLAPEATGARKANASPACTDHAAFGFEREVPLGLIWSAAPLTREIAQPVHGGIAEMCGDDCDEVVRERTDALDALGNTTAATGKGFAIGSAALTATALIAAFMKEAGISTVSIDEPTVLSGAFIGACLPFLFAALTMLSVGRSAEAIIYEVRAQFTAHPELKTASVTHCELPPGVPDYERCVAIATEASIVEMVIPGVMAVFTPVIVGYLLGSKALAGMLVGSLVSGFMLAVTMANAGGAWDNAKKYVEKNGLGEGMGKGTSYHEAVVIGDTVGDPFKDTSGPALNILLKLMSIISLVLAPSFYSIYDPKKPLEIGSAFPGKAWYGGVIILVVMLVFLYFWNNFVGEKYAKIGRELDEAAKTVTAAAVAPVEENGALAAL